MALEGLQTRHQVAPHPTLRRPEPNPPVKPTLRIVHLGGDSRHSPPSPAQAQINNTPPGGGPGGGRRDGGPGVESGPGSAYRSPEVNTNNSLTFRLLAPNAKSVRVLTDMPKLGEVTVHGSAGYDMVKDETSGIWSHTTPALPPSYYQYWFIVTDSRRLTR